MKLKQGIVLSELGGVKIAVAAGELSQNIHGFIKNNTTSDFLYKQLQTQKSEEELVAALLYKYDVSEKTARQDVSEFLKKLKKIGVLENNEEGKENEG